MAFLLLTAPKFQSPLLLCCFEILLRGQIYLHWNSFLALLRNSLWIMSWTERKKKYPTERWLSIYLFFNASKTGHTEENKSTLYESQNNSVLIQQLEWMWPNKVTVFSKKLLRAVQGLACQHIFMCKTPLPYLFLAMWSKGSYFILRGSTNSWLSLIIPHNPLNCSHICACAFCNNMPGKEATITCTGLSQLEQNLSLCCNTAPTAQTCLTI